MRSLMALTKVVLYSAIYSVTHAPMRNSLIACSFGLALTTSAQAADVDWKMYGTASIDGGVVCFYEGKGVIAQPALRVWAKCLLQKDLDSMDFESELGKKIVESAARKACRSCPRPVSSPETERTVTLDAPQKAA